MSPVPAARVSPTELLARRNGRAFAEHRRETPDGRTSAPVAEQSAAVRRAPALRGTSRRTSPRARLDDRLDRVDRFDRGRLIVGSRRARTCDDRPGPWCRHGRRWQVRQPRTGHGAAGRRRLDLHRDHDPTGQIRDEVVQEREQDEQRGLHDGPDDREHGEQSRDPTRLQPTLQETDVCANIANGDE